MDRAGEAKRAMRAELRRRRAALDEAERIAAAARLAEVAPPDLFAPAGTVVAGFMPIRGEIDPAPLMTALAQAGARLALPRVEGGRLSFRRHGPGDALTPGAYGILEPEAGTPELAPEILLVPLLAFDRRGGRLGYGAGYYDRAIAALQPRLAIGLAFAAQEVAAVPMEAHDRPLDLVLTERGLIDCRRPRGA